MRINREKTYKKSIIFIIVCNTIIYDRDEYDTVFLNIGKSLNPVKKTGRKKRKSLNHSWNME